MKWLRKKLLKGIVKDLLNELPDAGIMKEKALKLFEVHKDEILEKVKQAIKTAVLDFCKEHLG